MKICLPIGLGDRRHVAGGGLFIVASQTQDLTVAERGIARQLPRHDVVVFDVAGAGHLRRTLLTLAVAAPPGEPFDAGGEGAAAGPIGPGVVPLAGRCGERGCGGLGPHDQVLPAARSSAALSNSPAASPANSEMRRMT